MTNTVNIACFPRLLEDVFRVTIPHLSRRLQGVFKASSRLEEGLKDKNILP